MTERPLFELQEIKRERDHPLLITRLSGRAIGGTEHPIVGFGDVARCNHGMDMIVEDYEVDPYAGVVTIRGPLKERPKMTPEQMKEKLQKAGMYIEQGIRMTANQDVANKLDQALRKVHEVVAALLMEKVEDSTKPKEELPKREWTHEQHALRIREVAAMLNSALREAAKADVLVEGYFWGAEVADEFSPKRIASAPRLEVEGISRAL